MTDIYAPDLHAKTTQAWFGGSFDPVHNGHLIAAREVLEQLHLDRLNFTPCYLSPHKQRAACSSQDRVKMLHLAIEGETRFALDLRELEREGPSYTVDTLSALRAQTGEANCLLWVVGWDAFLGLHTWHQWQRIGELCNLVVINRPGFASQLPQALQEWCVGREVVREELLQFNFGKLLFLNTPMVEVSSSLIRERRQRKLSIRYLLPDKVAQYIVENRLFLEKTE